jgi:Ca2+-binding EF-hand superfamily protein
LKKNILFDIGGQVYHQNSDLDKRDFGIDFQKDIVLMIFFKSLSNRSNKLDQSKLKAKVDSEFGEIAPQIWPLMRRVFANFRHNIDFKKYYIQYLVKFLTLSPESCKEILFNLLDINKDKRICETDLFMSIKNIQG